jgi:hypothetical protein
MTLDQLHMRDARIAALEALGRARTPAETDELGRLVAARDMYWRRLPAALERARRKAAALESYARQHRLPLEEAA